LTVEGKQVPSKKEQRQLEAKQRQKLKPLRDALVKAEQQVEKLYQEQHLLERLLADPDLYIETAKEHLKKLLKQKAVIDDSLARAEAVWMDASENLELAGGHLYV
jgi:ATP-binding cassette subfamily F protein 3